MAITRKTVKDSSSVNSYDATTDVFNLVKSGSGAAPDHIYVDSTSDNFSVRYVGNTLVMKGEDGQIIKINITKPASGATLIDTISFLDGDVQLKVLNTNGKTAASLVTLDTVPKILKLTTKYVAFALDLTDSGTGSADHFAGTNSAPTAVAISASTVAENATGAVIGTLTVTDPDASDSHTFTVSDTRFEVVSSQLKLKAGNFLDFETEPSVNLTVTATDSGGLTFDKALTITVTDVFEAGATLTAYSDTLSSNSFDSGLVYTPGGNDRINALQDEDVLTGTGTNPTLNLTLGNHNDNGTSVVTPQLINIQTVKVDFTGSANTLDLRNADSIATLDVNRITAAAGSGNFENISQVVTNFNVHETSKAQVDVNFSFAPTVLVGKADSGLVTIKDVNLGSLYIGSDNGQEGYETLTLNSTVTTPATGTSNLTNVIKEFTAVDLENLTITGSGGTLQLLDIDSIDGQTGDQRINFNSGNGVIPTDSVGLRSIDASAFTGTLDIDITNAVGGHTDPVTSGVRFYADIKGGTGIDTFWSAGTITGESATLHDKIDGGTGANVLRAYSSIIAKDYYDTVTTDIAAITNIQTLEIREDDVTADLNAFDANLTTVKMRDEHAINAGTNDITLLNIGTTLATSGNLILLHPQDGEGAPVTDPVYGPTTRGDTYAHLYLADASGATDSVKVTVQNDYNTELQFNYKLDIDGNPFLTGTALKNQKVESVTIADSDSESNKVELTAVDIDGKSEHTTAVTLTGGTAKKFFEVSSTLIATTVDGSLQASDLRLTVGTKDQTIKLGSGDDILTFAHLNDFTAADIITDVSGTDTIRAAFDKDVTGTPTLTGIEKLHIVATKSMSMDLTNAGGITELAILSDKAVDNTVIDNSPNTQEPFGIAAGLVSTSDEITLNNTSITTLNFFADNDTDDGVDDDLRDAFPYNASETPAHIFNGVKLIPKVAQTALTVAINSSLDKAEGADSYSIGLLTLGGSTVGTSIHDVTINVGDERAIAEGATASTTTTTINGMLAQTMQTLTVTANGNVDLGTITGSGTKNNVTTVTTTGVLGDFTAKVVGMANNSNVNLGNGVNDFSAFGSSGTNVTINGGTSGDTLVGTAQIDNINGGAGDDHIHGYNGTNVLDGGAGDDLLNGWQDSDTYSLGTGTLETVIDNYDAYNGTDTLSVSALSTPTIVTLGGTAASVYIDLAGLGGGVTWDTEQMLANGDGTTMSVKWITSTLDYATATLDGIIAAKGSIVGGVTYNVGSGAKMLIADTAAVTTFNGSSGADAFIVEAAGTGAATARIFDGAAGNDAFVGSSAADTITGGTGADRIVLAASNLGVDAATDVIKISTGESTSTGWDQVVGFQATAANQDKLDLAQTSVVADIGAWVAGAAEGSGETGVTAHWFANNGQVWFSNGNGNWTGSFSDSGVGAGPHEISLTNALNYLANELNGTNTTVEFTYDRNGDGVYEDTIVFQDGSTDTVVQLVGVAGYNSLSTVAGAGVIQIA
jgi:hypothetical protein